MSSPRDWIDPWPHGNAPAGAPSAAVWVAQLAATIRNADIEPSALGRLAGLDPRTVEAVVDGRTWPEFHTVVALADAIRVLRTGRSETI